MLMNKKYSGIKDPLRPDTLFRCSRCFGKGWTINDKRARDEGCFQTASGGP